MAHSRASVMGEAATMRRGLFGLLGAAVIASAMLTTEAEAAARCRNTGSFEAWLAAFKQLGRVTPR